MKLPILWSDAALHDMLSIFNAIMDSSPQNALLVDDRINEQIQLLAEFPLGGRSGELEGTRELVINKATSVVVYRVEETAVRILRVMHGGQMRNGEV